MIYISVSKLLTTVTENHKESKKTVHHKLKEYTMQYNSIQKIFENYSMFSFNNSHVDTHKLENKSVSCH